MANFAKLLFYLFSALLFIYLSTYLFVHIPNHPQIQNMRFSNIPFLIYNINLPTNKYHIP